MLKSSCTPIWFQQHHSAPLIVISSLLNHVIACVGTRCYPSMRLLSKIKISILLHLIGHLISQRIIVNLTLQIHVILHNLIPILLVCFLKTCLCMEMVIRWISQFQVVEFLDFFVIIDFFFKVIEPDTRFVFLKTLEDFMELVFYKHPVQSLRKDFHFCWRLWNSGGRILRG